MTQPLLKATHRSDDADVSSLGAIREMIARESMSRAVAPTDRHVFAGQPQDLSRPVALGLNHPEKAPPRHPGPYPAKMGRAADQPQGGSGTPREHVASSGGGVKALRRSRLGVRKAAALRQGCLALTGLVVLAVILFNPALAFGAVLLFLGFCATSYLMLGYDTFWKRALRPVRWYVARHPEKASKVHRRLDRFALGWDAVLDHFPEQLVAGLYLPDVSDIAAVADAGETSIDLRMCGMGRH